jgi:RND family efflux transporter MFP subunit
MGIRRLREIDCSYFAFHSAVPSGLDPITEIQPRVRILGYSQSPLQGWRKQLSPHPIGKVVLAFVVLLAGCNPQQEPQAQAQPAALESTAPEPIAVTRWSDRTELFMEYPPLVAGGKGRAAVHLTDVHTFKAVTAGKVTIDLEQDEQVVQSFETNGPSSPGIFGVDLEPRQPGSYSLVVSLRSPSGTDTHDLGTVTVYSNPEEALAAPGVAEVEAIAFLKEQQWTLDFATEPAAERAIRESLRVAGEVRPRSGGEAEVSAPITGRIADSSPIPVLGASVTEGQTLALLNPPTPAPADLPALEFAITEANVELEHTRRDRQRVERLLEVGAIPARRGEEARDAEDVAEARLKAAQERLAQYKSTRETGGALLNQSLFTLRSPLSGIIADANVIPGSNATQGDRLFRVVSVDSVYIVANVPEAEAYRIPQLSGAEIEMPGVERAIPMRRLVTVSRFVDPNSRTLSVTYEAENSDRRLAIGQALSVRLFLSQGASAVAVPEEAVIDDGGRPVVFVQVAGESFARRPVRLGARAAGYVQVFEGVSPGERVVTRGAYLIRLAALSPQVPAHGHVH